MENSSITSARQIKSGDRDCRYRGRLQGRDRRKGNSPQQPLDERSKGHLREAEESENMRVAIQSGNLSQVEAILNGGEFADALDLYVHIRRLFSGGWLVDLSPLLISLSYHVNAISHFSGFDNADVLCTTYYYIIIIIMSMLIYVCACAFNVPVWLCLIAGFDPNMVLSSGWSALMHAADMADVDMAQLLLDHGANPRTKKGAWS